MILSSWIIVCIASFAASLLRRERERERKIEKERERGQ